MLDELVWLVNSDALDDRGWCLTMDDDGNILVVYIPDTNPQRSCSQWILYESQSSSTKPFSIHERVIDHFACRETRMQLTAFPLRCFYTVPMFAMRTRV